tara:strand:+ start:3786 stop:4538 length:753 start_codon:yes stop_codon:yes gene_type:complete
LRLFHFHILLNAAIVFAAFFFGSFCFAKLKVNFVQGKIEAIQDTENKSIAILSISPDDVLPYNQLICSAKGSRAEFYIGSKVLRVGSLSVLSVLDENSFFLHSGSMLISFKQEAKITLSSFESNATFSGSGTILVETTKNGGFKFIPFEGRGILETVGGDSQEVKGGRLVLVLGKHSQLGDAYDLDLMLLLKTCRLINSFPDPLDTFGRISLAVYSQELKLKGKYNALIGDATTDQNLQIWAFGEESQDE